jgi:hypothetical protein
MDGQAIIYHALLGNYACFLFGHVVAISLRCLIELQVASDRSLQILPALLRQLQLLRLLCRRHPIII